MHEIVSNYVTTFHSLWRVKINSDECKQRLEALYVEDLSFRP